ncbi:MAG: DegT/DnrJ/EryC1/StrS family aminotransferase [Gemmatimonadaceae bacterium]
MSFRHQLPVSSTITARSLIDAIGPALGGGARDRDALGTELKRAFGASDVALVDCGTSALVLALRIATREGGTVALPAYACVDIGAAAIFAKLRVRLYDVDPVTLSPDLESVSRVLGEGIDTIVVAHLFGYPANVPGVAALAAAHGVTVIEDAAQGAWGKLLETRLGAFGPLTVLSFGRGKGMTGGGGGALLGMGARYSEAIAAGAARLEPSRSGLRTLALTKAQWILGRPSLYAIPSAIPALHLGETIYHPAHEPRGITGVSASLVRAALARANADLAVRRTHAEELDQMAARSRRVRTIRAIPGSVPGYLRFPVRVADARMERSDLGIVRGYPNTIAELVELQASLSGGETLSGARELQRTLVTLPTHAMVNDDDLRDLTSWLG